MPTADQFGGNSDKSRKISAKKINKAKKPPKKEGFIARLLKGKKKK